MFLHVNIWRVFTWLALLSLFIVAINYWLNNKTYVFDEETIASMTRRHVGGLFKVKGKCVSRSEKFDDDSKIGDNATAEEATEGTDDSSAPSIDVVLDNRLQKTGFGTKKEFMMYFLEDFKEVEAHKKEMNPDIHLSSWRTEIQNPFKNAFADFGNYECYTGEYCNPDGRITMVEWQTPEGEVNDVPCVYFIVNGLKEEKA